MRHDVNWTINNSACVLHPRMATIMLLQIRFALFFRILLVVAFVLRSHVVVSTETVINASANRRESAASVAGSAQSPFAAKHDRDVTLSQLEDNQDEERRPKCPAECQCGLDSEQRLEVLCLRGN